MTTPDFKETRHSRVFGGLSLLRSTVVGGWYERGTYATAYGYVEIYRQCNINRGENHTQIAFIYQGAMYIRTFQESLTDHSLKIQAGKLASYAYQKEQK